MPKLSVWSPAILAHRIATHLDAVRVGLFESPRGPVVDVLDTGVMTELRTLQSSGQRLVLAPVPHYPPVCCPAAGLMEIRAQAERDSSVGLKLFGFIPESCSGSSRIAVRNHPGTAFMFPRIPQSRRRMDEE
jgi:hypothetical protein